MRRLCAGLVLAALTLFAQTAPAPRSVIINRVALTAAEITAIETQYRTRLPNGRFWYDSRTGAWGLDGGPTLGFVPAGLRIGGPLPADASGVTRTGTFINGRELHLQDVIALSQIVQVQRGRFWVDALGNAGYEGGPALFNLAALARAAGARRGGAWSHYSKDGSTSVGGDGNFFYFMSKDSSGRITSATGGN